MQEPSPVTRPRAAAKNVYDRLSRWYGIIEGIWERKARRLGLALLDVHTGESVLEVASGPGEDLQTLAQAVQPGGLVVGFDLSTGMLQAARQRLASHGLEPILVQGDAVSLPFADRSFEALFSSFTLELFDNPDIPLVIAEFRRVLRPGGRLCVLSLSKKGPDNTMRRLYEWSHRRFPAYIDCRPIYVSRSLQQGGFEIQKEVNYSLYGLPVEIILANPQH